MIVPRCRPWAAPHPLTGRWLQPTATMERVEKSGQVATARTLARMLSATPHHASGPSLISILDIHALQEAYYFSDDILVKLKSCAKLLRARLNTLPDVHRVSICFPDDGAFKRFHLKFEDFPTIVCTKVPRGCGAQSATAPPAHLSLARVRCGMGVSVVCGSRRGTSRGGTWSSWTTSCRQAVRHRPRAVGKPGEPLTDLAPLQARCWSAAMRCCKRARQR